MVMILRIWIKVIKRMVYILLIRMKNMREEWIKRKVINELL